MNPDHCKGQFTIGDPNLEILRIIYLNASIPEKSG